MKEWSGGVVELGGLGRGFGVRVRLFEGLREACHLFGVTRNVFEGLKEGLVIHLEVLECV